MLSAVFIMDQSVCRHMEESLKHWKLLCSLNQMQNRGKLHSAEKLYGRVCAELRTRQIAGANVAQFMVLLAGAMHSLWIWP